MLIRVIDFECTGLEPPAAAICEIGYTDVEVIVADHTSGLMMPKVGETVSFFCNPGHPMPPEARAVHHICDADLVGAMAPEEGTLRLTEGAPAYYVAHKADFERSFWGMAANWLCTYKVALRLWPDAPAHSNQVLRYFLDLQLDQDKAMPPHRAGPDSYVTAHLLARMIEDGRHTIDDFARWSSAPALLPKVTFGKHKGKKWSELPIDYLDWIVAKSDLDNDTKANARHWIRKHGAADAPA